MMEPSAVVPNYDQAFPIRDSRRPSQLTVSSYTSSKGGGGHSPEPSPTKSKTRANREETCGGIIEGPFMYVGPDKRRYHAKQDTAPYPFPCGLEELTRMNMLHYVLYHIFDKRHYLTQFKNDQLPKRVLDIGCGTGIWIHDVAQEWRQQGHTDVEFHGVDLVPIQSPMKNVKVKFHYVNVLTDELPWEDGFFDYVHIRGLAAGVPENCWLGDHKNASGVLDKAFRVLKVGGYFEVVETNLIFSYYDLSVSPPKPLPPELVFSKEDTIAPLLAKVYTERQHTLSPAINLGINPLPLSILPAHFTFLPVIKLHTIRRLIPVARFNVPMIRPDDSPPDQQRADRTDEVEDSVARVMGYISAGETYKSLRPDLLRLLRESNKTDALGEFKKIEQRSHRRWLAMDIPMEAGERSHSLGAESESSTGVVRKAMSAMTKESIGKDSVSVAESVVSGSRSSGSWEGSAGGAGHGLAVVQSAERGEAALDKVRLRREVGGWWGIKAAD